MSSKVYVENHTISSDNLKGTENKTMLVLSDLHFHPRIDRGLFLNLMKCVMDIQPDYVVMPGDILDTDDGLKDELSKKFIDYFMKTIAEVSSVIIIPGNHDIANFNPKTFFDNKHGNNKNSMDYLDSLNKINNIYFLNNEQTRVKDVTFCGLNPRNETYFKYHDKENNEIFMSDYEKCGFKINDKEYNVLLCHNPLFLFDKNVTSNISDFSLYDLAIAGHFHDGYMPKFAEKYIKDTNIGIFTLPLVAPYPGVECRGVHDFGRGHALVSQGFRKYGTNTRFFNALDSISAHDIEHLTIEPETQGKARVLTK